MRRPYFLIVVAWLLSGVSGLHAQDVSQVCHATSSYDLTVQPNQVIFDRSQPAPMRIVVGADTLQTDGVSVSLNDEAQDRLALFQQTLRALVPRVKAIAQQGVDLAIQAIEEESNTLNLDAGTRAELQRRLAIQASDLHRRVANSESTHDWHGDAANQYANQVIGDIAPLLASAMGQQAISAAMSGDLQQAAALREQAENLTTSFQPHLQQKLQALRPQIEALCPAIRRLSQLQQGLHDNEGRPLHLVQVAP